MTNPLTALTALRVLWPTVLLMGSACASAAQPLHTASSGASVSPITPVELALMTAAVDSLARDVESAATLCIQVLGGPEGPANPPAELLAALTNGRRVVSMADCPATYARMIGLVDSLGRSLDPPRPPGYIDPVQLSVGRPQFDRPGYAVVHARRRQGTGGQDHRCVVQVYESRAQAVCQLLSRWVH